MEMGYSVIKAAEAAREGKSMQKIKEMVKNILCCSRFLFAPNNLTHLRNGGRIGGAQALIGNMLKITPILTVADDGKTDIFDKVRTQKKAIEKIVTYFKKETEQYGVREVTVHHINELNEAESLVRTIESMTGHKPSVVSIGPIIGLHVGPGTIGLTYTTEREIRKERMSE
jgi:DegV family protein with EDD domain